MYIKICYCFLSCDIIKNNIFDKIRTCNQELQEKVKKNLINFIKASKIITYQGTFFLTFKIFFSISDVVFVMTACVMFVVILYPLIMTLQTIVL